MKKIFTLIAAALMTMGASAQTKTVHWEFDGSAVEDGGGKVLAELPEIKLTAQMGEGASDLKWNIDATAATATDLGGNEISYTHWIAANNTNGRTNVLKNPNCAYFQFEPKNSGTIQVMVQNAAPGKEVVAGVIENNEFTAIPTKVYPGGVATELGAAAKMETIEVSENYTGYVDFAVEAGKTYIYCLNGSKGRIMGFSYTYNDGGGNASSSAIGIFRKLDLTAGEVGDCSVAEAYGVKVTPIRGKDATYREEAGQDNPSASDLYIGYSLTNEAKENKAAFAVAAEGEVIYPKVAEQGSRQEEEYFGFTMDIPADNPISIDALDVYLLSGNAYQWQVEITDEAGNVVYKTQDKGIKINNYNKTAYTNGVHVTTTEVTEPKWTQELLESWSLATNYDVTDTEVLPTLTNLTGKYTVKVYYWGKWQKNLTYANVYIYATSGAGETTSNNAGIYRTLDLAAGEVGECSVAEAYGVKVTPIRGKDATYREEAGQDDPSASDLYIGYSLTNEAKENKAAFAVAAEGEVIYPKVAEQGSRQEEEYFGFTMDIPEGKAVNIDALDVYLLSGNAYQWQVEITDEAGSVVYKTQDKGIKINNYNKTAYTNGVHVTTTEVTEPKWTQELLESWSLATNYDVTDTEVLPALTNLTGKYTIKVYYWGKWQKNLTYANVYLELSEGTVTGISSISTDKTINNGVIYNLAGQRVSAPVKGQLYIKNGKKFIQK